MAFETTVNAAKRVNYQAPLSRFRLKLQAETGQTQPSRRPAFRPGEV